MAPLRFYDTRATLCEYANSALVRCPRCDGLAHRERQSRVICRSCGLARVRGESRPPLWLSADTRHGTIWAYNLEHLTLLREHAPWYEHEHRRMTYVARLPAWIKSAKNRAEILRTIDRLRATVINP